MARGHIRQRNNGTWAVVIYRGPGEDGKKKYDWHTAPTEKAAEALCAELIAALNKDTYIEPSKLTVAEYLTRWLADYAATLAPKTCVGHRINVHRHIVPALGAMRLNRLQPLQIQSLYAQLQRQGLAPRTILYIHRTLSQALGHAVQWELLARNPAKQVPPPRTAPRDMSAIDIDQARRILALVERPLLRIAVQLALYTGLRRGEIAGLRWADINLERRELRAIHSLAHENGELVLRRTKTHRSRRTIPLPQVAVVALRQWRKQQKEWRLAMGPDYAAEWNLILTWPDGRPVAPDWLSHEFCRFARRHGLGLRFHDLRHAHATILLELGTHPKVVQERLGHSQIGITLDTYSHVAPTLQADAADKLDKAFS